MFWLQPKETMFCELHAEEAPTKQPRQQPGRDKGKLEVHQLFAPRVLQWTLDGTSLSLSKVQEGNFCKTSAKGCHLLGRCSRK